MAITTNYRTRSDAVQLRSFAAKGRPSAIAGVGTYAPERIISNFDLEKMMDTSDKWITERTGIHRRHIAEPGTTTFEVATRAGAKFILIVGENEVKADAFALKNLETGEQVSIVRGDLAGKIQGGR